jgi:hypothetical protein
MYKLLEMPKQHSRKLDQLDSNNRSKPSQPVVDLRTLRGFVKRGESNETMEPSEDSSITGHDDETFGNKSSVAWSNLNLLDASDDSTTHPSTDELIHRNMKMIEARIISIMKWRHRQIKGSIMSSSKSHSSEGRAESSYKKLCNDETDDNDGSITEIPEVAKVELELYVRTIANRYNKVLYHNFEHASHVTACVNQLITMLQDGNQSCSSTRSTESTSLSSSITSTATSVSTQIGSLSFDNFIKSNPMVHLSMVISALIHDVEHKGIGNKQLVDENDPLALKYKGKSVAENNSFDVATDLLYEDEFQNLRRCIFGEIDDGQSTLNKEVERHLESYKSLFYQVSHDVVMATDISCPNRLKNGKLKWIKAFEQGSDTDLILSCGPENDELQYKNEEQEGKKRRSSFPQLNQNHYPTRRSSTPHVSTNPTEFIADPFPDQTKLARPQRTRELSWMSNLNLNGSTEIMCPLCGTCSSRDDAFHCMSYTRLSSTLEQILQAADVGHTMQSWSVFIKWNEKLYNELWMANIQGRGPACHGQWFAGQISFIDNYIFPLAQRLKQCGVFGSLGSLFYDNASLNRKRWMIEGNDLCRKMHDNATKMFGASQ